MKNRVALARKTAMIIVEEDFWYSILQITTEHLKP